MRKTVPPPARTAIARRRLSAPVREAIRRRELHRPGTSVLDYGCGRGGDVARLRAMGYDASGWDPHWAPSPLPEPARVVLLSFVLNVIEDPEEMRQVLARASSLVAAPGAPIVSVRVDLPPLRGPVPAGWRREGDGWRTSSGTFQRPFTDASLRRLLREQFGDRFFVRRGIASVWK